MNNLQKILKTLIYQKTEKPDDAFGYVATLIGWAIVIILIAAFNVFISSLDINKYLVLLLRIWSIVTIPFVFPAWSIATNKKPPGKWFLFRFNSIIGMFIVPFCVYKNLDEVTF